VELYPAVDVQGGRVARSLANEDPIALAQRFARDGARWIHLVDLDNALGTGHNRELVQRVVAEAGLPVQVGGGLSSEPEIAQRLAWGAHRVVVGSRAAIDAALIARLVARYGAERLAVGIDVRDGRVAPRGSGAGAGEGAVLDIAPLELARLVRAAGIRTVVYTDAARDGMLAGPDLAGARALAALEGGLDVIVSGGVASLDDLRRARDGGGLAGAIVGRALHEGRFTLREALACVA
jgi:phosphoribosylformimino-5-aminoimidazole carboxamide ribotide isomerase